MPGKQIPQENKTLNPSKLEHEILKKLKNLSIKTLHLEENQFIMVIRYNLKEEKVSVRT